MKGKQPNMNSGKTRFNRGKSKGESWTARRAEAIKNGTFNPKQDKYYEKKTA